MESRKSACAPIAPAWCRIASRLVSPSTWTAPASASRRSARSRSCSGDSSPDTYSVRTPARSRWAAACSSSVDLPIPGSPPTRITEEGTMPPPRTKSSSAIPVRQRPTSALSTADKGIGGLADGTIRLSGDPPIRRVASGSSTSVFHAPQASQRPAHLGCSAPQSVQRNNETGLGTDGPRRRIAVRPVVEARVLLFEIQLHRSRGTVALLADDQLGQSLDAVAVLVGRSLVHLRAIDEADQIGVLLDGAGLAQIGELRAAALAGALLGGPRQLGQRDHGHVEL